MRRKPYDARTLRYVARALTRERDALNDLFDRSGADSSSLRDRARQCEIHANEFNREASALERKARK